MVVPEAHWQELEVQLSGAVDRHFRDRPEKFEVHATELRTARGFCKGMSVTARVAFRDEWMGIAARLNVRLIYRAIEKRRYQRWLYDTFGTGVVINPHVAAFALLSRVVDDYFNQLADRPLGMFIFDENKEVAADLEKSIRVLRWAEGALRLRRVIEKGFFIDSASSLPLQLCDVFALSLRKMEERRCGAEPRSIDESGIVLAEQLVHRGLESHRDVLAWLTEQQRSAHKRSD